jgi:hypothetical protein
MWRTKLNKHTTTPTHGVSDEKKVKENLPQPAAPEREEKQ